MRALRTVCHVLALALTASAAYTVQAGDTLSAIAARFHIPVADLARANAIEDPDRLFAGHTLVVPASRVAAVGSGGGLPTRLQGAPERLALVPRFRRWASANGLPVDLLMATTWLESGWQNSVVSPVGAIGIGQLMPGTVEFIRSELIGVRSLDPAVPEHNIRMSARYLRWLLKWSGGEVRTALAGYYQGPASVRARGAFPGTVLYVDGVLALRSRFTA